jgi:hypothetical protein
MQPPIFSISCRPRQGRCLARDKWGVGMACDNGYNANTRGYNTHVTKRTVRLGCEDLLPLRITNRNIFL